MTADWDASGVEIKSERLRLKLFTSDDAAITPAITRFMQWEPPRSPAAFAEVWRSWLAPILDGSDLHFVARSLADGRCLGLVGLHAAKTACPEIGIWIREDVHGNGIGREPLPPLRHGRLRNSIRIASSILSQKRTSRAEGSRKALAVR